MKPSFVVFGAYYGNDLLDDLQSAKHHGILQKFASPSEVVEIERLEEENNIGKEIGFLYRRGREPDPDDGAGEDDEQPGLFLSIMRLSKTFVLIENIKDQILTKDVTTTPFILSKQHELSVNKLTPRQREYVSVFNNGDWKTVLTARYRNRTMLPSDLRIRVAARIQQETIIEAAKRLEEKGIRLIVVFMPTKENVFWPRVKDPEKHPYLSDLVENEKHFKSALKRRLKEHAIGYVDPLEQMRQSEAQPYYADGDGHPNQFGHRIVAEQLLQYMTDNGWLKNRDGKYVAARTKP